ncbi:MAG: arylsulfatase [Firmicutes bacterium]|nr:arylsulfatase [Bacillota bacterium]
MPQNSQRPNVVLITCDQLRGDCLGIEHPVVETPNLDGLARSGVVFERAYSAVPSCIAARASILTGMSQRNHGRVGYRDGVYWDYPITLPGEFAKAGYHTQGVGKMHFHPARSLCGFHNVVLHDGYLHVNRTIDKPYDNYDDYVSWLRQQTGKAFDLIDHGINCNSWVARPWHLDEHLHPTNWVVTQSIEFLRRRDPRKPFFLWMSFVRPHAPLDPPQVYFDQYIDQDLPLPPLGDWADQDDIERWGLVPDTRRGLIDKRALHRARAAYYALVTHIDHQIGRFLEALNETRELDNTVILFTSDHGELLGDHNLFRKSLPYEGSARVPFVLRLPNNAERVTKTVDKPVELRDVLPTLLQAAGLPIPDTIDGKSVVPLCRGERIPWREYIHGEHSYGEDSNHWLVSRSEKYIWYSQTDREQLFDLALDPKELRNLADDPVWADHLRYWRSRLVEELKDREEGYSDGKELVVGATPRACLSHVAEV